MKRQLSPYRRGRNLYHYCRALVEFDRATHDAETQRQRVWSLLQDNADDLQWAFKSLRLALQRRVYAQCNVTHYQTLVSR